MACPPIEAGESERARRWRGDAKVERRHVELRECLDVGEQMPVGAVDVHYNSESGATAALVVCSDRLYGAVVAEYVADVAHVAPYEPGRLFERELPCITAVVRQGPTLDLLVVDGFATLDPEGRPGLGAYAAAALGVPVIGVAKTPFRTATHAVKVLRGTGTSPLYVTVAGGIDTRVAASIVAGMSGDYRVPTAIARADRLARGRAQPVAK